MRRRAGVPCGGSFLLFARQGAGVQVPTAQVSSPPGLGDAGSEAAPQAPPGAPRQPQGQCSRFTFRDRLRRRDVPSQTHVIHEAPVLLLARGLAFIPPRVNSVSWWGDDEDDLHGGLLPLLTIHLWAKGQHRVTCGGSCPLPGRLEGGRAPSCPLTGARPAAEVDGCSGRSPWGSWPHAWPLPPSPTCDSRSSS